MTEPTLDSLLTEVQILKLEPGDMLVIKSPRGITQKTLDLLARAVGRDVKVLGMDADMELQVVRAVP